MQKKVRAKFTCDSVKKEGMTETAHLHAVYGNNESDNLENNQFSQATPFGDLSMNIDNENAHGFFIEGENYYLDFSPADK